MLVPFHRGIAHALAAVAAVLFTMRWSPNVSLSRVTQTTSSLHYVLALRANQPVKVCPYRECHVELLASCCCYRGRSAVEWKGSHLVNIAVMSVKLRFTEPGL